MATSFQPLDQASEDALHATRLLQIEERPFKRLTKRLLGPDTPYQRYLSQKPSDSPQDQDENDVSAPASKEEDDTSTTTTTSILDTLHQFQASLSQEFSTYTSSLLRTQLLLNANARERARYTEQKSQILLTADTVRSNLSSLHTQLEQARETLEVRKGYDVLAAKITEVKELKERGEQEVRIERLRVEIEEAEREGEELNDIWSARRSQLRRVGDEMARLRRQVRGEKEPEEIEAEMKAREAEAEAEAEGDGDEDMLGVDGEENRRERSQAGTPRPGAEVDEQRDGGSTPLPLPVHDGDGTGSYAGTPLPSGDVDTPLPESRVQGEGEDGEDGEAQDVNMGETESTKVVDTMDTS